MAKVSIITLTWNKPALMLACIDSLGTFVEDKSELEWIIVNNDDDKTDDYAKRLEINGIKGIILEHDNSGCFSSMNNVASSYASGEYILFLNNDVLACSDFIPALIKCFDDPACKVAGSVLRFPNNDLQHAGVIFADNVAASNLGRQAIEYFGLDVKKCDPNYWDAPKPFHAVTAACSMMRMKDFRKIGGFHEEFKWAFDDVDLCLRACMWLDGYCLVTREARLVHAESSSGGERSVGLNYEILRNRYCEVRPPDYYRFL